MDTNFLPCVRLHRLLPRIFPSRERGFEFRIDARRPPRPQLRGPQRNWRLVDLQQIPMRINQNHAPSLLHLALKLFTTRRSVPMQPFCAPGSVPLLFSLTLTLNIDGFTDLSDACDLSLNQFTGKGISLGVPPPLTSLWLTNAGIGILTRGRNATHRGWRQLAAQRKRNRREQKNS